MDESEIQEVVATFYTPDRIAEEVRSPENWDGWLVALDGDCVVGAGGGGMIDDGAGEIFVLYVDPALTRHGIGTKLLHAITNQQTAAGAQEQWVSSHPENDLGLSFYDKHGFEFVESISANDPLSGQVMRLRREVGGGTRE